MRNNKEPNDQNPPLDESPISGAADFMALHGDKMEGKSETLTEETDTVPFDWWDFLSRAKAGKISSTEKTLAIIKASAWPTCACGQLCKDLPRYIDGCPQDTDLTAKGWHFMGAIVTAEWEKAEEIMQKIEARTNYLLSFQRPEDPQ